MKFTTTWQSADTKPAKPGTYLREPGLGHEVYSHWNGSEWGCLMSTPEGAEAMASFPSIYQHLPWREREEDQ